MHYYQFNIADYQSHTKHLTPIEDICYRRLLDWQYLHEKPIPKDIKSICRLLILREYQDDVEQILNEFFELTDDGWINARAFSEINEFHLKSKKASEAGKASAAKRSKNNERSTDVQRPTNERSTDVQPTINQEPLTINQEPSTPLERGSKILTGVSANEKNENPDADASPSFAQPSPVSSQKLTKTHVPQPFRPTEAAVRLAAKHELDVGKEADLFVEHYESTGELRTDWQACFRKWLLRSMQFKADAEQRAQSPPKNHKNYQKFNALDAINGGDGYGNKRTESEQGRIIDIGGCVVDEGSEIQKLISN